MWIDICANLFGDLVLAILYVYMCVRALNSRVEDGRWQSRGATVAQSRFRGMSLMRLLIQSRGCGGVGLRQATGSNEDEDEDEDEEE